MFRVIPVIGPGTTAFTFALARDDEAETAARQKAAANGLIAGPAKEIVPDPAMWSLLDSIKRRHSGQR